METAVRHTPLPPHTLCFSRMEGLLAFNTFLPGRMEPSGRLCLWAGEIKLAQLANFSASPLQQGLLDNTGMNCLAWLHFMKTSQPPTSLNSQLKYYIERPNRTQMNGWLRHLPNVTLKKSVKWRLKSFGKEKKWTVTVFSLYLDIGTPPPAGFFCSLPISSILSPHPFVSHTPLSYMQFCFGCMPWRLNYARSVILSWRCVFFFFFWHVIV